MDQMRLFDIIYALAAKEGREETLFGNCAFAVHEAFSCCLTGEAFPELWFEIPLSGDPWLDFHALVSYEDVAGKRVAFKGHDGVYADALSWFASQPPRAVRQLALSYDTSTGDVEHPAVQLLVSGSGIDVPLGFLEAAGRSDAKDHYRAFAMRIPREWYACYVGTFPGRSSAVAPPWIRVECIVGDELQLAYADDGMLLRDHLAHVGLDDVGDAIAAIQKLASSSFPLEFQFNVGKDGVALPVLSASIRFQPDDWTDEVRRNEVGRLMVWLQSRGLIDERWQQFSGATFAKRVSHGDESVTLSCFPAFVKLRWREGAFPDVKSYLLAIVN